MGESAMTTSAAIESLVAPHQAAAEEKRAEVLGPELVEFYEGTDEAFVQKEQN